MKDIEKIFIDDNDIFDHDEIFESSQQFIMDLIDQTNFIADTNIFVEDTQVVKNGNCWSDHETKNGVKRTNLYWQWPKIRTGGHKNSLMKTVKMKNEFINEEEKTKKWSKKRFREQLKKEWVNIMMMKETFQKSLKNRCGWIYSQSKC